MDVVTTEPCERHVRVVGYITPPMPLLIHPADAERLRLCRQCGALMLNPTPVTTQRQPCHPVRVGEDEVEYTVCGGRRRCVCPRHPGTGAP